MFVKNYLKLVNAIEYQTNIHDLHDLFLASEDYLKSNPELVKAENDFERMIKQQISDAIFSYFPELKPREISLRKQIEDIIDECAGEIFSTTFDIIYNYLENPDRFDHDKKWDFRVLTEEETLNEAMERTKHLTGENRKFAIQDSIEYRKVMNHFYYFNVVLHKAILNCISAVYLEIPLLSGNGIRFLDYTMARESRKMKDKLMEVFHMYLEDPEFD